MKFRSVRFLLGLLALLACLPASAEIRYHRAFHSQFLPAERDIVVYLPPGYDSQPLRRYPVLYMQDGQNLADGAVSPLSGLGWRADETAQALIEAGKIRPLIIVGIFTGDARIEEYTPTVDPAHKRGGQADLYGKMLVEEVKPFIDAHYRTSPHDSGLGGSSLGGLVTLYLDLKYPGMFDRLAVMSPSVWWDGRRLLADLDAAPGRTKARIWLDVGADEGPEMVEGAEALRDALMAKGWVLGRDLAYLEDPGAKHGEAAWAKRFPQVLEFLYGN